MRTRLAPSIVATALLLIAGQACGNSCCWAGGPRRLPSHSRHPKVIKTLEDIKADDANALAEQKRITEIPAPPYKEKVRAEYFLKRMQELGFKDAYIDSEGNVIALRKGTGGGRPKARGVGASRHGVSRRHRRHREGKGRRHSRARHRRRFPRARRAAVADQSHERERDRDRRRPDVRRHRRRGRTRQSKRGVKALFRDHADIDGFISIDGLGITRVVNQATGSHRYEMIFKGPGGHSFQEFGLPSAIHAMGRAIAKISDLQTPSDPKTTFTVGTVSGGTSVNAIAGEARMAVDMRSNSTEELLKLEARLLDLVKEAVAEENARWNSDKLTVEIKLIGDRPAGIVAMDSPIVQATQRAVSASSPARRA
jgi:tripeptide aminopeptidase